MIQLASFVRDVSSHLVICFIDVQLLKLYGSQLVGVSEQKM